MYSNIKKDNYNKMFGEVVTGDFCFNFNNFIKSNVFSFIQLIYVLLIYFDIFHGFDVSRFRIILLICYVVCLVLSVIRFNKFKGMYSQYLKEGQLENSVTFIVINFILYSIVLVTDNLTINMICIITSLITYLNIKPFKGVSTVFHNDFYKFLTDEKLSHKIVNYEDYSSEFNKQFELLKLSDKDLSKLLENNKNYNMMKSVYFASIENIVLIKNKSTQESEFFQEFSTDFTELLIQILRQENKDVIGYETISNNDELQEEYEYYKNAKKEFL